MTDAVDGVRDIIGGEDEEPVDAPRRRLLRVLPWIAAGLVAVGIAGWPSVRDHLVNGELHRLDMLWADRVAMARTGDVLAQRLGGLAVPGDTSFGTDLAAIDNAQARALARLRDRAAGTRAVTGEVRDLRTAIVDALDADITDMRNDAAAATLAKPLPGAAVTPLLSITTWNRVGDANRALSTAIRAHHLTAAPTSHASFTAPVDWQRYDRIVDAPTGLAVWAVTGDGIVRVDLDSGRTRTIVRLPVPVDAFTVLRGRAGDTIVYAVDGGGVTVRPPDKPAKTFSNAGMLRAPDPSHVWVVADSPSGLLRYVDADGKVSGTIPEPHMAAPRIAVPGGILAPSGNGQDVVLWRTNSTRPSGPVLPRCGEPVTADGQLVAWTDCVSQGALAFDGPGRLHFRDLATGRDRLAPQHRDMALTYDSAAAFSPDGRWLAGFWVTDSGSRFVIVDVQRGQMIVPPDVEAQGPFNGDLAWSPDSTRVVFTTGWDNAPLGIYDVRTGKTTTLRWHGRLADGVAGALAVDCVTGSSACVPTP